MNDKDRELITKLVINHISYEEFMELFPVNIEEDTAYFDQLLNETCIERNSDDLGLLFSFSFVLDLFQERHIETLNKLIIEDWHVSHLNIAILLQYFKSNLSVESLYKTILTKYDPTECTHPLLVRCMWALGDIKTDESKEKLVLLSREKDEFTRRNAKEQLIRIRKEMRINMRRECSHCKEGTIDDIRRNLIKEEISHEEFLNLFIKNIGNDPDYFDKLLDLIYKERNSDDLELLFYVGFKLDLFSERHIDILNKLILEDWHKAHEDVAELLKCFKSNLSVESLYKSIFMRHEYLSNTDVFLVKCIHALGDIKTEQSKEKLELLSKEENDVIRKNAKYQLKRIQKDVLAEEKAAELAIKRRQIGKPTIHSLISILKHIDADYITDEACNALSILDVNDEKDQEEIIEKFIIAGVKREKPYGNVEFCRGYLLVAIEKIDDAIAVFKQIEFPFENDIYDKLAFLKRIYKMLFNEEV